MKDSYFWGSLKNPIFRGGEYEKPTYSGRDCLKREAWTVCRFNRGIGKKEGVVFSKGIDTPMHTVYLFYMLHQKLMLIEYKD